MNKHDHHGQYRAERGMVRIRMERTTLASLLWRAARAGWIPITAAQLFEQIFSWFRRTIARTYCDQCAVSFPPRACRGLAVHLHTHRVNVARHWGFCSHLCRETWLGAGAAEDLWPIVDDSIPYDPAPFTSDDGQVQVSVFFDDGPGSVVAGVAVVDAAGEQRFGLLNGRLILSVVLASPQEANSWWRSPAWMTTGLVEVCADLREAA